MIKISLSLCTAKKRLVNKTESQVGLFQKSLYVHILVLSKLLENYLGTFRDANSPANFIPRGFGESGNCNLSFLGDRGN